MKDNNLVWSYVEGRVNEALPAIKRQLCGYMANYERLYIGATTDPGSRWHSHQSEGWQKMIVLYKSRFPGATHSMETKLVRAAHDWHFSVKPDNPVNSAKPLPTGRSSYFTYALVGKGDAIQNAATLPSPDATVDGSVAELPSRVHLDTLEVVETGRSVTTQISQTTAVHPEF